jgi:hypothetical protein
VSCWEIDTIGTTDTLFDEATGKFHQFTERRRGRHGKMAEVGAPVQTSFSAPVHRSFKECIWKYGRTVVIVLLGRESLLRKLVDLLFKQSPTFP